MILPDTVPRQETTLKPPSDNLKGGADGCVRAWKLVRPQAGELWLRAAFRAPPRLPVIGGT